jgi:Ca2+-binding EF-hand superfamily protein
MAHAKESAELKSMFRQFDKDGSGFLDIEELAAILQSTGHTYTVEQVQEFVDSITGVPGSTGLSFDQFSNILRINLPPSDNLAQSRSRFDLFDLDQSDEVTFVEFAKCITGLDELITSSEIEMMFQRADEDESGTVDFAELLAILEQ